MTFDHPDLFRVAQIIALTQCAECPQTIPQSIAIAVRYFGNVEVFCCEACREAYEERLNEDALAKLRRVGL